MDENMEKNNVQKKEEIVASEHVSRYQVFQQPDVSVNRYGTAVRPIMGIKDDISLSKALEREILIDTGTWSSTYPNVEAHPTYAVMAGYTPLRSYDFPDAIFTASPNWIADKLRHFKYMHASFSLTVKVNATKFQQGCLWIRFNPRADVLNADRVIPTNFLAGVTSYPGVLLNLRDTNSVTLDLPYCCEFEAFDLTSDQADTRGSFGTILIDVISPLDTATTPTNADFSVFARFKDVKLYIPTPAAFEPTFLVNSSEPSVARGPEEEIDEKSRDGVVTTIAKAVAAVSDATSFIPIPMVSSFSRVVGWMSRKFSDWSQAHGLSKPNSLETTTPFLNLPARGFAHVEGLDTGVQLAALQDNQIEPFSSVVCDEDEMAFAFIWRRPFIKRRVGWPTSLPRGAQIFDEPLRVLGDDVAHANRMFRYGSTSEYLNTHFRLWSGSIVYTLRLVGTFAHSGRLLVQAFPFEQVVPAFNFDDYSTTINVVWDITDSTECVFTVPYFQNTPMTDAVFHAHHLRLTILNELQAASNVADSVDVLIFRNFGPDFKVAVPNFTVPMATTDDATAPTPAVNAAEKSVAKGPADDNLGPNYELGYSFNREEADCGSLYCVGESITSVRALIKRFTFANVDGLFPETPLLNNFTESTTQFPSLLRSLSRMYRFWAGTFRYKIFYPSGYNVIWYYGQNPDSRWGAARTMQNTALNPFAEFNCPYYKRVRKMVIGSDLMANRLATNQPSTKTLDADLNEISLSSINAVAYEAAGDDMNFHFLVGAPVQDLSVLEPTNF